MLTFMRDKFKHLKWALWAVVLAMAGWHFAIGLGDSGMSGNGDTVAMVGDSPIERLEYERALKNVDDQYRRLLGEGYSPELVAQLGLRRQVLDQLIERKIALREAERLGLEATEDEVRERAIEFFTGPDGRFVGVDQMERYLRRLGYASRRAFERDVADDIVYQKLRDALASGSVVSDEAVRQAYLENRDTLTADYVVFDPEDYMPDKEPTTAELKRWYNEHRDDYQFTRRRARVAAFPFASFAGEVALDEPALEDYYESQQRFNRFAETRRARHILIRSQGEDDAARAKATELAQAARSGQDFAELARKSSEDQATAVKGGDLGFFGRGQMVPEFEEAVFALEPGGIAGPVKSSFGYHVIKLEEVKPPVGFEEARPELEAELSQREARKLAREAAGRLIEAASQDGLAQAAAAAGVETSLTEPFAETDEEVGVALLEPTRAPAFVRTLFSLEQPGELSRVPFDAGQAFLVLALEEESAPQQLSFEEVRDQVAQDARAARAAEAQERAVTALYKELLGGASFKEAAEASGIEVKTSPALRRGGSLPGLVGSDAVVAQAFERKQGDIVGPEAAGDRKLLLHVASKFEFDEEVYATEKAAVRERLESERGQTLWSSMIRSLRQKLQSEGRLRLLQPELIEERA